MEWDTIRSNNTYEVLDAIHTGLNELQISKTVLHAGKATTGHQHHSEEVYLFVKGEGAILIGNELLPVHGEREAEYILVDGYKVKSFKFGKVFKDYEEIEKQPMSIIAVPSDRFHKVINTHILDDLVFYSIFEKYDGRGK